MVEFHTHNGADSPQIEAKDLVNAPQDTVATITGSAGGTYTGATQTLIDSNTTAINDIILKLQNLGLIQ